MKLFFLKEHSLYKIFKTLEKVPEKKTVHIYIDPEHAFFENERWGKQIQELLDKKHINALFVTKTEKAKSFFENIGLQVLHQEKHKILRVLNLIYLFFFNIKKFHLHVYTKKNYLFYSVFIFEAAFIFLIVYFLYTLILPRTIITVFPSNQIENIIYNFRYYPNSNTNYHQNAKTLSLPFYTGFIDYKYTMSISVDNIKHIQNPSEGEVKIVNMTEKEYTLIRGTRFETNDGVVFKAKNYFKIPAKTENGPGETFIEIVAAEEDAEGNIIGARGNIKKGTVLYMKNLKNSYFLKEVYGVARFDFTGGKLTSEGTITEKDIEMLSGKLLQTMYQQKKNIVGKNFGINDAMLLNFDDLITTQVQKIQIENQIQEKTPYLKGYIIVRFIFSYIKQDDLIEQIKTYITQRPSDKVKLVSVDKSSIVFFNSYKKDPNGVYIVPTKVGIIQGYDFQKDVNGIVEDVKSSILGKTKQQVKEILLEYPEVSSAQITIRPPWYNTITRLKSRIKIQVQGQNKSKE